MSQKTFAIALMDAPYESGNLTTAFRILSAIAQRGHNINVFAYEGASGLAFAKQMPHPNPVHGKNVAEETTPRPRIRSRPYWRLPARMVAKSTG
jgi:tRNA 2-thiouridine synthesizing protein D